MNDFVSKALPYKMLPKNINLKRAIYLVILTCTHIVPVVFSTNMDADTIQDLMTPIRSLGDSCGYEGCPTPIEGVLNVHIVPHTHGELGELRTFIQHYTGVGPGRQTSDVNMKRILDYTISELWDDTKRKFTLFDTPYFFHWWANRDDTVHRMVYQLLRQGRLHLVGGGWGMPDEACTSYHAIIDQFTYALRKINKTLGPCARPLVAWQSDVYGHSREFTALASMLGFDGLFINPISFEDEVARMVRKELEMVWRGSDDLGTETDLFTHKLFDGYWSPPGFCYGSMCNDTYIITSDSLFKNVNEKVQEFLNSAQNRQGGNYVTNHIMMVMGKVWAYHDAGIWFQSIDTLIKSVNEKVSDKVHVMYSAPACYLKAVHDTGVPMPIKQDDFMSMSYDKKTHFTGHFTSRPTIKYMAREGHVYLQMAKQMYVLAKLSRKYTKIYEDLNWIMGLFQDHKIITGNMKEDVKDYYTHKMYRAVQKSTILLRTAFNKLRRSSSDMIYFRCSFNTSSCRNTNTLRYFVVIYNLLAWPVTVPIRLPVVRHSRFTVYNHKLSRVRSVMMKISEAVLRIPQRNTKADHEIVFIADKIPPMGYRSYFVESVTVAKHKVLYDVT